MKEIKIEQHLEHDHVLLSALSIDQQEKLRREWDDINSSPLAYVPHDERDRIDEATAKHQNICYGTFASNYMKQILSKRSSKMKAAKRMSRSAHLVSVGFGVGYDFRWLAQATRAGYRTCILDVSTVAFDYAERYVENAWKALLSSDTDRIRPRKPRVILGEIQSVLAEPETVDLDLEKVELWFFSRLLGCLQPESARIALEEIGNQSFSSDNDPECEKALVVINALKDHNPDYAAKMSKLWSKSELVSFIADGAGRPMQVCREQFYTYYTKTVTAMTIMAKPE